MLDRLVRVGGECSWWAAELPVEVDGGGEGEDARGHAAEQSAGGFGEVVLEAELILERVDDRFDPLPDASDRGRSSVWFVGAVGPYEQGAELGDGMLELLAGEALVGDHELSCRWLAFEQLEDGLTLGRVGGDEIEVADAAVGAAPEHQPHAPVQARMRGRVAEAAPGRELGAVDGGDAVTAGQRRRVDQAERIVEAGQLAGDRAPERDQLGSERAAALVVARLARQRGEEMREPAPRDGKEATVARVAEQHLRDHQAKQLVVGDQLRASPRRLARRRKERAGSAIDCDQEGVEVGAHVGLLVDGALTPPTFDTLALAPYPAITAPTVNYRSSV